ncbi:MULTISPECIES: hypothetical protein [unclassified Streptomyces]|uniref:hypothetical protein n=1 Tax=unclassified Streptomyces TaxID=2593676 RepID=UPI0037F402E2
MGKKGAGMEGVHVDLMDFSRPPEGLSAALEQLTSWLSLQPGYRQQLPMTYMAEPVRSLLSLDAQIYLRCPSCASVSRLNPTLAMLEFQLGLPCLWDGSELIPVRHLHRVLSLCADCDQTFEKVIDGFGNHPRCPHCQSKRSFALSVEIDEDLPSTFREATSGSHTWGEDPYADVRHLHYEVGLVAGRPEGVRHAVPLSLFAARLANSGSYGSDGAAMENMAALLLDAYHKRTREPSAGVDALKIYLRLANSEPSDQRAWLDHNVAMAAFSLISQPNMWVNSATQSGELLRRLGLHHAILALSGYEVAPDTPRKA